MGSSPLKVSEGFKIREAAESPSEAPEDSLVIVCILDSICADIAAQVAASVRVASFSMISWRTMKST